MTEGFPFIVGFPRSGTTLVRAMLDSHPALAIPGESHFIPRLLRARARFETGAGVDTGALLSELAGDKRFVRWGLDLPWIEDRLGEQVPGSVEDLIRLLYGAYAAARGKDRYGDKTPDYLRHLPILGSAFPEAIFVHVIRDGRDAAQSYRQLIGDVSVSESARRWRDWVGGARSAGADLGPSRYLELGYETLVADPETVLADLCGFLKLSFDERMLRYFERAEEIAAPALAPERHRNLARPPTPGLRDWRTEMTRRDVARFETIAGRLLLDLGYPLSGGARDEGALGSGPGRTPGRFVSAARRLFPR